MVLFKKQFFHLLAMSVLLVSALAFVACSSSGSSNSGIPVLPPNNMALTAKSGLLIVQYSKVASVGAEGSENFPAYEISIGTLEDGSNKVVLGTVPASSSNLQRFSIYRDNSSGALGEIFPYPSLVDGQKYWIFVRSDYTAYGHGYSDYAKLGAVAIPVPAAVTGATVDVGDKRVVVSWNANEYEEYGINIDDCPRNNSSHLNPGFWGPTNFTTGNNYVFTVDNNTAGHNLCVMARNINGAGAWYIFGDTSVSPIVYDQKTAVAATAAPDTPVISSVTSTNKRLVINFMAALTGSKSVAEYQYSYKKSSESAWSTWETVIINTLVNKATGAAQASIPNLDNDVSYDVKIRAINTMSAGVESAFATGTPRQTALNFNNPDEYLSRATSEYIYAENVPHSDFWRISTTYKQGGRPGTDRLVRGKETAIGNLYADAVQWYVKEKGFNSDFAWLIGDMVNTGIQSGQAITPKFLRGITNIDYHDDVIIIVSLKGSDLINSTDYSLPLNNYPAVGKQGSTVYAVTLFGQAASAYRNGHYGGSGGTSYNGAFWALPSKEARYTIEYLPYSLAAFNNNFDSKPACVAARDANDGAYNVQTDSLGCYLMTYDEASPVSGNPGEASVMGYKRGRIKSGTLTVGGVAIDPNKTYYIATTRTVADSYYVAFLKGGVNDTGISLLRAVAEYVYENDNSGIAPQLDGRVKLEGGVPGDSSSDF